MISYAEFEKILSEIADEMPAEFFVSLNGGIRLLPDVKMHPEAVNNDLYIMGEYHYDSVMGRYISIYYGSFARTSGQLGPNELREKITHTLKHEFRHHLESLGGQRDLEITDSVNLQKYKGSIEKRVIRGEPEKGHYSKD